MECCHNNIYSKSKSPFQLLETYDYYDGFTEGLMICKHCSDMFYFRIACRDFLTECIRFFYLTKIDCNNNAHIQKDTSAYRSVPITHFAICSSSLDVVYLLTDISKPFICNIDDIKNMI